MSGGRIEVLAPDGIGEVAAGADLVALLVDAFPDLADGDVVVVTSKIVSKAEGRTTPGTREDLLAGQTVRVVARRGPTTIVENRLGLVMAAAGIDNSNVEAGQVVLLPRDPDASARALRTGLLATTGHNVAVVVTDTAGRAWRQGQTDLAIGAAGLVVLDDHAGRVDSYGNPLAVTAPALADEVAGAADLAQGKLARRPVAVVRGLAAHVLRADDDGPGARSLKAAARRGHVRARRPGGRGRRARRGVGRGVRRARTRGGPASPPSARVGVTGAADGERVRLAGEAGPEARAVAHAHGWVSDQDVPAVLQPHLP